MGQVIEYCDDEKYSKFLKFVMNMYPNWISNIGTVLSKVPMYSKFEQIFSAGFEGIINPVLFNKTINDIPKSLVKIAKDKKIKISDKLCDYWKHNPNAHYIGYSQDYISLTDDDISRIWGTDTSNYNAESGKYVYSSYFNRLIDDYGYTAKALFSYIDILKTYEALDDIRYVMCELYDYATMMKEISDKFDKYPRNFLTTHKIACRNYNRLKKEFSEKMFRSRIIKEYECSFGDYQFIYPKTTQEIKDEAVQQNNCVASYIDDVIDGKCHIMFLRKKATPDTSLVTIEIRHDMIVQAKRKFNNPVTEAEQAIINAWNKKFSSRKENVA